MIKFGEKEFISSTEAAEILGVSDRSIQLWYSWYNNQSLDTRKIWPLPTKKVVPFTSIPYFSEKDIRLLESYKLNKNRRAFIMETPSRKNVPPPDDRIFLRGIIERDIDGDYDYIMEPMKGEEDGILESVLIRTAEQLRLKEKEEEEKNKENKGDGQ